MRISILLAPIAALVLFPLGCGPADALRAHTSEKCVVHFRGDYLGMASSSAISVGLEKPEVTLRGTLRNVDAHWLTLESGGKDWVIPREAVLSVSFKSGKVSDTAE